MARSVKMASGTGIATVARDGISLLNGGSYFTLVGLLEKAGRKMSIESLTISSQLCPRGGCILVVLDLLMPLCKLSIYIPSLWPSFKGKVLKKM